MKSVFKNDEKKNKKCKQIRLVVCTKQQEL